MTPHRAEAILERYRRLIDHLGPSQWFAAYSEATARLYARMR